MPGMKTVKVPREQCPRHTLAWLGDEPTPDKFCSMPDGINGLHEWEELAKPGDPEWLDSWSLARPVIETPVPPTYLLAGLQVGMPPHRDWRWIAIAALAIALVLLAALR